MQLPQIVAVGIYNSHNSANNKSSSHNRKTTMFEIELPIEKGGISYINTNTMPITPNMLICAKPGQTRHTKFPFKCYYIHIIMEKGFLYDTLMNIPDFFETENHKHYKEIFSSLCKYYDTAIQSDEIIIQSLILKLIYSISKDANKQTKRYNMKSSNYLIIEKTLNYIKENLAQDLTLEKVSEIAHLSPIHFHNMFKASVGKTLHNYVEEQRIKKAINLLITTDYSLTKIAFECGFSSQSYFSYVFKRRMKVTPREYVQEIYKKYEI